MNKFYDVDQISPVMTSTVCESVNQLCEEEVVSKSASKLCNDKTHIRSVEINSRPSYVQSSMFQFLATGNLCSDRSDKLKIDVTRSTSYRKPKIKNKHIGGSLSRRKKLINSGVNISIDNFFLKQVSKNTHSEDLPVQTGDVFVEFEDWLEADNLRTENEEFLGLGDILLDYGGN